MTDAADALTSVISDEFLMEFEQKYNAERETGVPSADVTFQYAWCLVRSRLKSDIKKGILMLEELLKSGASDATRRRDYLYYLSVGHGRNRDYNQALKYVKLLLQNEPGNKQAQGLEKELRKAMDSEALKGAAIAGGGLIAAGALVGLGFALLRKS